MHWKLSLALGLVLGCCCGLEASIIRQDGKDILVNNLGTVFDRGSFRKLKKVDLAIPDWDGKHAGQEVMLKSLSLGFVSDNLGITHARYLTIRCEDGSHKSARVVKDEQNPFRDITDKEVPRLIYTFEHTAVKVGDVYTLLFYGEGEDEQVLDVRYAVAAGRKETEVFSDFSFRAKGKRYFPVYELRLGLETEPKEEADGDGDDDEAEARKAEEKKKAEAARKAEEERKKAKQQEPKQPKDHTVTLSLDTPKRIENREKDNDRSYSYYSISKDVTVKTTQWSYKGKVVCDASKKESTEVIVQALFLGRKIGSNGSDRVFAIEEVGRFQFGGDNPKTQKFTFVSPEVEETKTRRASRSYNGWGSQSSVSKSTREGLQYGGVVLRAIENGKLRKVISSPSNQTYVKLGKEMPLEQYGVATRAILAKNERELGDSLKKGEEEKVLARLPGTGESTIPGWMDDYYAALDLAKEEGKLLLVVFSGSDWCGWCKVLANKVLSTEKFQRAIKDRYVLVYIDSPNDKSLLSEKCRTQNPEVAQLLKTSGGVPDVNIVSADGVKLKGLGGARHTGGGVDEYLPFFESADRAVRLMLAYNENYKGADRYSPEGLKALHETLMRMDGETLIDLYRDEMERLIAKDGGYAKYYPCYTIVKPLRTKFIGINSELTQKAREAMRKDGAESGYSTEMKYRQQIMEAEGYEAQFTALLREVNAEHEKLSDAAARYDLQLLKNQILGTMRRR